MQAVYVWNRMNKFLQNRKSPRPNLQKKLLGNEGWLIHQHEEKELLELSIRNERINNGRSNVLQREQEGRDSRLRDVGLVCKESIQETTAKAKEKV